MSNPKTPQPAKKKEDMLYDLEQQFLLRLPPGTALALRRDVEAGVMNLKDKLFIEISHDMRHGKVTYGGHVFNAKLVDLPCIIETLKTTDRKSFYKTADISQMLVANNDDDSDKDEQEIFGAVKKKEDKKKEEKKYQWTHGITPPMKNVRKRRFRKTMKKKEQPDIEKEVKRLFRMDNEALDVKWEVVIEEDKSANAEAGGKQVLAAGGTTHSQIKEGATIMGTSLLELAEHEIFGDVSSSGEDEDEKDVNIMDSGDEGGSMRLNNSTNDLSMYLDSNMSTDGDMSELQGKLHELGRKLEDVRERRMAQELELAVIDEQDVDQKVKPQIQLNKLIDEEIQIQKEYEILSSMLSQG